MVTRIHFPVAQDSLFNRLESDMKSVVDQFFRHGLGSSEHKAGTFSPSVDVEETPEAYTVRAELPGLTEEDIELDVVDNMLVLAGEKRTEQERKENGKYYFESRSGSFKRVVPLEAQVDEDGISADLSKGVLTVQIPKRPEEQPLRKRIEVKSS